VKKVGKLEDHEVMRVMKLLEQARTEVAAGIAVTEWQAHHIPQLKEAVSNALEGFRQQYNRGQAEALINMWNAGIDMVDHPLQSVGVRPLVAMEINREALEIMQGYSADLINGLSADALKKINSEITLGIMGQKSPFEVMQTIGRNFDDKSVFTGISRRAETITRTEMSKVHSMAREARMHAVADGGTDPEMKWQKKWISSGKAEPRPHHAGLNGVIIDMDEDFLGYIPYPHAPGLAAEEVINCG